MMKKNLIAIVALGVLVVSCGPSSEDYKNAADELCGCSTKFDEDLQGMIDAGITDSLGAIETQYGICIKKVEDNEGVDFKSDEMLSAIKENCPDIEAAHKEFIESAKGGDEEK